MSVVLAIHCADGLLLAADGLAIRCRAGRRDERVTVEKIQRFGPNGVWALGGTQAWKATDGSRVSLTDYSAPSAHAATLDAGAIAATLTRRFADVKTRTADLASLNQEQRDGFGNSLVALSNAGGRVSGAFARVVVDAQAPRATAIPPEWNNMGGLGGYYCFGVGMDNANRFIKLRLRRGGFRMLDALGVFAESVAFGVHTGTDVGWPIRAAFVTPDAIRVVRMDRERAA